MSNSERVRALFSRLWCERDFTAIDEFFAPGALLHGLAIMPMNRDGFRAFYLRVRELVPDVRIDVTHVIEHGDWICMRGFASGTHRETGTPVTVWGGGFARLSDGMILETHETWDLLALMIQIGRVPADVAADMFPES